MKEKPTTGSGLITVDVEGKPLTYFTDDVVSVGDEVNVSIQFHSRDIRYYVGVVIEIGSDYRGVVKKIDSIANRSS